jgi:hypothetical protein
LNVACQTSFHDLKKAASRPPVFVCADQTARRKTTRLRRALKSSAGAAFQALRACISLSACDIEGNAKTPLIMNRKIRRPAGALQATGAGRTGQSATHLVEGGLRILFAKSGIRGLRESQAQEKHQT